MLVEGLGEDVVHPRLDAAAEALLSRALELAPDLRDAHEELFRYYVEESVAGRAEQTPEYNPLRNSGHESGDSRRC